MHNNEANEQNNTTSEFRQTTTANDKSVTTTADAAPLYDLTAFQRDILRILADDGQAGLRIKDALDDLYDVEITHGRLYPNLNTLVEKGFAKKEQVDGRTNKYSITARGRREFCAHRNWMTRPLDDEQAMSEDVDVVGDGGASE